PSPRTLRRAFAAPPLASGAAFQLDSVTVPARLSPVALGSARPRGPRASPHQFGNNVIFGLTSFSTPAGPLSKSSLSRALKFDTDPSRIPPVFVDTKFESTRTLDDPPSTRIPALKRCPRTLFCAIVMAGAVMSNAARAINVSPAAGLKPAPQTVSAVALKD